MLRHIKICAGSLALSVALGCSKVVAPSTVADVPIPTLPPADWQFLVVGGGAFPDSNQISIEDDTMLAAAVLGPRARVLFAGGRGTQGVQVSALPGSSDDLVWQLAALFDPRPRERFQPTRMRTALPATLDDVKRDFLAAFQAGQGDFALVLLGHGTQGEVPQENQFGVWGGEALTPRDVALWQAEAHHPRRLRLVVSACFAGGFSAALHTAGDPSQALATPVGCGFFAAPWDEESSGCDPNPDRRAHEGYAVHFFNALTGRDRQGKVLPLSVLDLDHDGQVSALEAHMRVVVAAQSFDRPTITSHEWLRAHAPVTGPMTPVVLPEEEAVLAELGAKLGNPSSATAQAQLDELQAQLDAANDALHEAQAAEESSYRQVAAALLTRWPALNDPWHPDFRPTLQREATDIKRFLREAISVALHRQTMAAVDVLQAQVDSLMLMRAPWARWVQAHTARDLAARLRHKGGGDWQSFEAIRACERVPLIPRR